MYFLFWPLLRHGVGISIGTVGMQNGRNYGRNIASVIHDVNLSLVYDTIPFVLWEMRRVEP
jgi:hypothetical protein